MSAEISKYIVNQLLDTWCDLTEYLWKHPDKLIQSHNTFNPKLFNVKIHETFDKRFQHVAWQRDLNLNFIKRSYFLLSQQLQALTADCSIDDEKLKKRLNFYVKQYLDGLSPTNSAILNPAIIDKIIETNGTNLIKGFEKLYLDLSQGKNLLTQPLTDHSAFTLGKNIACTPGKVVYENKLMQLIHYTPMKEKVFQTPILMIPPWINKFYILDLQPENSLVRWLLEQQFNVFMISWVNPTKNHRDVTFTNYLQQGALQAIKIIRQFTTEKINAVGYCTGGTLLGCLLAYLAKKKLPYINSASFFTTLFDFSEPGELGVFISEKQISSLEQEMKKQGYLHGKLLASVFSTLRANDLVWTAFINQYLKNEKPKPFDLLYWNDDPTNVPEKVHSFYLRELYLENKLIQKNVIKFNGVAVDLATIKTPCYFLAAQDDHIIPWQASFQSQRYLTCEKRFVLTDSGHVAGVVNPPQRHKYGYRTVKKNYKSADKFLSKATHYNGSWWLDWHKWLCKKSGKLSENYLIYPTKSIEPAPGRYVKKRIK